jgi:4-hydroxy-3-methylbut-2-enyl diphosphate reductase
MPVIRAATAGFCMGVDLALRKLDNLLKQDRSSPIYTFGPLIHNPQVIEAYADQGVRQSEDPEAIEAGSTVLIRAHGIPKSVYARLAERGVSVEDATCPRVMKAQRLISRQAGRGQTLLLYGEANHPEVRGLLSHASHGALVFDSLGELKNLSLDADAAYFLAAQTTQDEAEFERIQEYIFAALGREIRVLSTICDATMKRQQEAVDIAKGVDLMVVVGGYNSGNTRRLAKVAMDLGVACLHVETPGEISLESLRGKCRIGLTAGASTPKTIVDAVEILLKTFQAENPNGPD